MAEAVDLTPIELALQAWVVAASGLTDGRVIWSGYGARRPQIAAPPDGQWISLLMTDNEDGAWPWVAEEDNPHTFTAFAFTADVTTPPGLLTATAHARLTGDGPVQLTTTGALPAGLALETDYWVIKVAANTFRLASSFEDAMATVPVPVAVTTAGTGVHTLAATDDTLRAGEEQITVVSTNVNATLSIQCYGGPPTGNRSPMNVLRTVVSSAMLPTVQLAFEAAGIDVDASARVNNVGAVISTARFEPRAHVDVSVSYTADVSEFGTIITRAEVTLAIDALVEAGALAFALAVPLGGETVVETVETTFDVTADDA